MLLPRGPVWGVLFGVSCSGFLRRIWVYDLSDPYSCSAIITLSGEQPFAPTKELHNRLELSSRSISNRGLTILLTSPSIPLEPTTPDPVLRM